MSTEKQPRGVLGIYMATQLVNSDFEWLTCIVVTHIKPETPNKTSKTG